MRRMSDSGATMPIEIVSGGQSGVDRAALDLALECALPYAGWCPRGGWAEDFPQPPGVLEKYPGLTPTPLADPAQRTEWNVRDSDASLFLVAGEGAAASKGTRVGIELAKKYGRPCLVVSLTDDGAVARTRAWLAEVRPRRLGIGGPRESEAPGIHAQAKRFLAQVLTE
jgi:hypothetical protein